jgi:hypothetical protein
MKKLYIFTIGLIAGAILAIIFFPHSKTKPEVMKSTGQLSGTLKISPDSAQKQAEKIGSYDYFTLSQKPVFKTPEKSTLALGEYKVPVSGKLETDSNMGKVDTQLSGVTIVTIGPDDLKVDTQFSGSSVVQVPSEKNWRVYVGIKSDYPNIVQVLGLGYQKILGNFYYDICGEFGKNGNNITSEVKLAGGIRF